jgi:tetratricopeptide (TPR) repeat protein
MNQRLIALVWTLSLACTMLYAQTDFEQAKKYVVDGDFIQARAAILRAVAKEPSNEDVLQIAATIYFELEQADTALLYAKRAFAEDDDNPAIVRLYAKALSLNGKPDEASTRMRALLKKDNSVESYSALVDALVAADSAKAASLVAAQAREKYPKSPTPYLALGNIYFNSKPIPVYELARSNYEEAIKLDPTLVEAHFNLAQCYWKLANRESDRDLSNELFTRSLQTWADVTRLEPNNARAWFEQGKILYLGKRYKDAAGALVRYRALRPLGTGQDIASWYLGSAFYELNACDSARTHLNDAASRIDSVKSKASLYMARCTFRTKQWKEAAAQFATADAAGILEPSDVWYYGTSLVLTGDTTKAIEQMTKAASLDPKQCQLMFRFALLLQGKNQNALSTDIFKRRLAHCSDSLDGRILLFIGNNFFADSLVDSADAYYKMALAKEPGNCFFQLRSAEVLLVRGDVAGARTLLESIATSCQAGAETNRKQAEQALIKLCALDLQDKAWKNCISHAKSVLAVNEKNPFAWLYLGIGLQGDGNKAEACKAFKKVLEIDAANKFAKDNLSTLGC